MKIREVQISNFRAFNDVESSTFNFTNSRNELSDLISIYAPNGFGKTSFYDAVEWGVTGKIERFDLVADFDKTRRENKKGGNKNILQHIGANDLGFVNVVTGDKTYRESIAATEYNHKKLPRNRFFRDVILSQELIDNFLKEQTAEERYNKFVESYPDVTKYNNIYKNIITLLGHISQEIKSLNKTKGEIDSKQLSIDFELEYQKYDRINEAIGALVSGGEILKMIEKQSFNETLCDILTSVVKSRTLVLEEMLRKSQARIEYIRIAREGGNIELNNNDSTSGVINYVERRNVLEGIDLEIAEIRKAIQFQDDKDKSGAEIDTFKELLGHELRKQERLDSITPMIGTYTKLLEEINGHQKRITDFTENNRTLENENVLLLEGINDGTREVLQLHGVLNQQREKLHVFPKQKVQLEVLRKDRNTLEIEIERLVTLISDKKDNLKKARTESSTIIYYQNALNVDLELLLEINVFKDYVQVIVDIQGKLVEAEKKRHELASIDERIKQQNLFNAELSEFISQGLGLIQKDNLRDCPLCSQQYESFETLSNSILNNKVFDEQMKELLHLKSFTEEILTEINERVKLEKGVIERFIRELTKPINDEIERLEKDIQVLELSHNEKVKDLSKIIEEYNKTLSFFGNNDNIDLFEESLRKGMEDIIKRINSFESEINVGRRKITENQSQLKNNLDNIVILNDAISSIRRLREYYTVLDYFKEEFSINEVNGELLETERGRLKKVITQLTSDIEKKRQHYNALLIEIAKHNLSKPEYLKKLDELNQLKLDAVNLCDHFEKFIEIEFAINVKEKSREQIEFEFNKLIEDQKSEQAVLEGKITNYKIVDLLKDDCLKVSVSDRLQIEINSINAKVKELKSAERLLGAEKDNLEKYLEKTIDEFFYTDLINVIYNKIDPHPDYESIEFKCEFGENKPRLQIFSAKTDTNGKKIISIPALYFSTAQINILSLSIFLSRALKTKNPETNEAVDCIFIDDPIQSMDSINILSFIDLFRGIITSLGKQLIVSTHEENFHLLLQKKIPEKLFKSKFIEFETFGKIKKVT